MKRFCLLILCCLSLHIFSNAQSDANEDTAYLRVVTNRAEKIVVPLAITDQQKAVRVRDIIAHQYVDLNAVYTKRDNALAALKKQTDLPKEQMENQKAEIIKTSEEQVNALHEPYLAKLATELTPEQVIQVKDGMTYGVTPLTYGAYVDMIPALTEVQKAQIMTWLVEAREHAMDAESSDKKHAWFGKYKGRINNYLSAEGYDSQKERAAWEERIKARKEKKDSGT